MKHDKSLNKGPQPFDAGNPETSGIDRVRAAMRVVEEIEMGIVPVARVSRTQSGDPEQTTRPHGGLWPSIGAGEGNEPIGRPAEISPEIARVASRCAGFPLNDRGNAQRFIEHFGKDLISVPRVGWFTWNGKLWERDTDGGRVGLLAQQIGELIQAEIPHLALSPADAELLMQATVDGPELRQLQAVPKAKRTDIQRERLADLTSQAADAEKARDHMFKQRGEHRMHARGSGNAGRIKALIELAADRRTKDLAELDADPLTINTLSGALKFSVDVQGRSRHAKVELLPHAREQFLTKMMKVNWDPKAACPKFLTFLERIQPDEEMRDILQCWFGLCLTGLLEQKVVFLYGAGANGKSVLIDLMAMILGEYAATAKIEALTGSNRRSGGEATPELVPLIGARLVRASEPEEGERLQEARIKEMTGGEPIMVRELNKPFVEVRPRFKLTISGNHRPEIRGTDDGIWRRVLLVPFDVQIPVSERDPDLKAKLWEERDGILQWMVDGLKSYLETGLREPPAVLEATAEYRDSSDPFGSFLTGACHVTGESRDVIRTADLVEAFNYWMREQGGTPWKDTTVMRKLAETSRHWKHPVTGRKIVKGKSSLSQYVGLRLEPEFKGRLDQAPRDQAGRILGLARPPAAEEDPDRASF